MWALISSSSFSVALKFRRQGRGRFLSAVGPRELFRVVKSMYRGKGECRLVCVGGVDGVFVLWGSVI